MYQLAVYGKGGIGKSTISANLSISLAKRGRRVMQVGCDPKHDSTRLLLGGRSQRTVLEYVRSTPARDRRLEDIIEEGSMGVLCAEAGGPEPGIGCAGRGILTTFDTLRKLGADDLETDYRIYDVLGDVVCGGFAVPLRDGYADGIILVTSGEFMSIYAANNIMKGLRNFDTAGPRLIGIVLNSRGVEGEEESVRRFAEAAGTEVIAVIPRDGMFKEAESAGMTVMEMFPDSAISSAVDAIADRIEAVSRGIEKPCDPRPLDDDQMSDLAAGRPIREGGSCDNIRLGCGGCGRRTSISQTRLMQSCAAYGAVAAFLRINDVGVVLHGPRSCSFVMDTSRSKAVLDMYSDGLYDTKPARNLRCTCMDDSSSIFGGIPELEACLRETASEGYSDIAVISTCMPGIIGDDSISAVDRIGREFPDTRFHLVEADGDMAGDYTDGFLMAARAISGMIDTSVPRGKGGVNLIGSSFFDVHTKAMRDELRRVLALFGLHENCRFVDETGSDSIRDYCRAEFDMALNDTMATRELVAILRERTGREPNLMPVPVGLREYSEWLRTTGELTGRPDAAGKETAEAEEAYRGFITGHAGRFAGKRIIIFTKLNMSIDWLIDMLDDLGAEVLRIGFAASSRKDGSEPVSRFSDRVTTEYDDEAMRRDIAEWHPDLVICDLSRSDAEGVRYARVGKIGLGVKPVLRYAEYLEDLMRLPAVEGWRS